MPIFMKDQHRVLFVHVPKTGGTSVEQVFQRAGYRTFYKDGSAGRHTINAVRRNTPQHLHAAPLRELFTLSRFDVVFMLVREPLARFRSEYAMRMAEGGQTDAESVGRWADDVLGQYAENPHVLDNHLRPQSEFYLPGSLVYRLEDGIAPVIRDLNQRLGLGLGPQAPRAMAAKGIASDDVKVSPELRQRLHAMYHADFERFGYSAERS